MRKKVRPIDALFPATKQGVLAATFGDPERWWYLSELAERLRTSPSSLQRELELLASSGLLRRRTEGRRVYYQAETEAAIFPELHGLVAKTLGVGESMKSSLRPLNPQIELAFIYGSGANAQERALSDIDLLVVGSVGLADLAPRLRRVEKSLNRHIDATVFTAREFLQKVRAKDHFLTAVLSEEKLFIVGNERELERLTQGT